MRPFFGDRKKKRDVYIVRSLMREETNFVFSLVLKLFGKAQSLPWGAGPCNKSILKMKLLGVGERSMTKEINYKKKHPYCVRLDGILEGFSKKYRDGKISQDTYFSICVDALRETWAPWEGL